MRDHLQYVRWTVVSNHEAREFEFGKPNGWWGNLQINPNARAAESARIVVVILLSHEVRRKKVLRWIEG